MSDFLNSIRGSVTESFSAAGETAIHTDAHGTDRQVTVIRMQTSARLNPAGYAFEDEGPWFLMLTPAVLPERGDHINFEGETVAREITTVENHNLRGYLRVTVTDL